MARKSNKHMQMRLLARKQENKRVEGINAHNEEMNYESELEKLIRENQDLPEQKKCYHGIYCWVGDLSNVCSKCFWWDKNPGLDF